MDGVESQLVRNTDSSSKKIYVYPNPTIFKYRDVRYYRSSDDYLIITGENIALAASMDDVTVMIGTEMFV